MAVAAMVTPEGAHGYSLSNKDYGLSYCLFTEVGEEQESRVRHVPGMCLPCSSSVSGISSTYGRMKLLRISFPFSLRLSRVSHSEGGRVTPFARAYEHISSVLSRSAQGQEVIGWSCWSCSHIYHKGVANKSAVFNAFGHFGQEVRKIEPSPKVSDKSFAHGNQFTDCVVAN
jgi:hypothetical protein